MSTIVDAIDCCSSTSAWHQEFLSEVLPAVHASASISFRTLPQVDREEATAEATATAMVAYVRLIGRGKDPATFAGRLAQIAVLRVRSGRLSSSADSSRDVLSREARWRRGFKVESLNTGKTRTRNGWRELVVEDRRNSPAEIAVTRLDFEAWLSQMPSRRRQIAECLAQGDQTRDVAKQFRISAGRISQMRQQFHRSWERFQAE